MRGSAKVLTGPRTFFVGGLPPYSPCYIPASMAAGLLLSAMEEHATTIT